MFKSHRIRFFLIPFACFFLSCEKDDPSPNDDGAGSEQKEAGAKAASFLSGEPYSEMELHLLYMNGYEPTQRAVDSLRDLLGRYLHKPNGIEIGSKKVPSPGKSSYGIEGIDEVIEEEEEGAALSDRIHAYLLIVDGKYDKDSGNAETLGVAYAAHRMALFGESVHEFSDDISEPERWKMEASVMAHEFGHILGLVDNGTPMVDPHRDSGNGHHCDNSDCLMYYAMETSDIASKIVGSDMPELDANCQEDLEANGGK